MLAYYKLRWFSLSEIDEDAGMSENSYAMDDLDYLTKLSETASKDYELAYPNYKNIYSC
jgi:hypothetical protein